MTYISSITAFDVLIEAIGVLGIIASIISFQCKKHKRMLLFRSANESLFALQYGLLGAYTGMSMNLIGVVRNVVFTELVKRKKSTVPARILFSAVFLAFTAITWAGFKSILSGAAKVLSTIAYGSTNFALTRILIFVTSSSWFVYNLLVKSYAGCACELLTIGSIVVSLIRYKINKNKAATNAPNADAEATDETTAETAAETAATDPNGANQTPENVISESTACAPCRADNITTNPDAAAAIDASAEIGEPDVPNVETADANSAQSAESKLDADGRPSTTAARSAKRKYNRKIKTE